MIALAPLQQLTEEFPSLILQLTDQGSYKSLQFEANV